MARLQLVHALHAGGADVHRGNYGGETPWSALPLPTGLQDPGRHIWYAALVLITSPIQLRTAGQT
jgi:hypothetical protein